MSQFKSFGDLTTELDFVKSLNYDDIITFTHFVDDESLRIWFWFLTMRNRYHMNIDGYSPLLFLLHILDKKNAIIITRVLNTQNFDNIFLCDISIEIVKI